MRFRQFAESLEAAGWEAAHDAQYTRLYAFWRVAFPAAYHAARLEAKISILEDELEGFRVAVAMKQKHILE